MRWQPIQYKTHPFPKSKRAGDAQPQLSFKKEEKKRLLDGMASYDLTLKETLCPRRY
jgi:hypothetical protein